MPIVRRKKHRRLEHTSRKRKTAIIMCLEQTLLIDTFLLDNGQTVDNNNENFIMHSVNENEKPKEENNKNINSVFVFIKILEEQWQITKSSTTTNAMRPNNQFWIHLFNFGKAPCYIFYIFKNNSNGWSEHLMDLE